MTMIKTMTNVMSTTSDDLLSRAKALKLYGVVAHWEDIEKENKEKKEFKNSKEFIERLISWEEIERSHRSLERRLRNSRIGGFKQLVEFDWKWPKKCDREVIEELMQLKFIKEVTNIIFCGPNGVGKSTFARNIAYQAVIQGHTVLFATAGHMLNDLASQDGDNALRKKIKYYTQPALLVIDELGYLSYSNRHADLLFEIVSRRYEEKPTLVTTNKPFSEWS